MKLLGSLLGGAVAGIFVFAIWPPLWMTYGVFGGWIAGLVSIGPAWFLNHYVGAIYNPADGVWVDMAWGIGVAGTVWLIVKNGLALNAALPTLLCVGIGAILGGVAAAIVTTAIHASQAVETTAKSESL